MQFIHSDRFHPRCRCHCENYLTSAGILLLSIRNPWVESTQVSESRSFTHPEIMTITLTNIPIWMSSSLFSFLKRWIAARISTKGLASVTLFTFRSICFFLWSSSSVMLFKSSDRCAEFWACSSWVSSSCLSLSCAFDATDDGDDVSCCSVHRSWMSFVFPDYCTDLPVLIHLLLKALTKLALLLFFNMKKLIADRLADKCELGLYCCKLFTKRLHGLHPIIHVVSGSHLIHSVEPRRNTFNINSQIARLVRHAAFDRLVIHSFNWSWIHRRECSCWCWLKVTGAQKLKFKIGGP